MDTFHCQVIIISLRFLYTDVSRNTDKCKANEEM